MAEPDSIPDSIPDSTALLQRIAANPHQIDLALRADYWQLLEKLGNPHQHLPPTLHVAGTNGKGSTIAFMRAMLEGAGLRVHVYTSPHLIRFHERIRLAGQLIDEATLVGLLRECEVAKGSRFLTLFEVTTAAAFLAFARIPADVLLLEVGLGGRLDATTVIPRAHATLITRISYDHQHFLGNTLTAIAGEKAGIFKAETPAILAPQPAAEAWQTLRHKAAIARAPCFSHGEHWHYTEHDYVDSEGTVAMPALALPGNHQRGNAATAIAALRRARLPFAPAALAHAQWPARLQRLHHGALAALLPVGAELWLDGGHNDSAGEVLATQATGWQAQDGKPLFLIYGMIYNKEAEAFLAPLAPHLSGLCAIAIPGEAKTMPVAEAAQAAKNLHIRPVYESESVEDALKTLLFHPHTHPPRFLITGSLYLAGHVLARNGAVIG